MNLKPIKRQSNNELYIERVITLYFMESTNEIYESFDDYLDYILEAADKPKTHYCITELYPKIESVLSTVVGDRKFKDLVGKYIDRNSAKLHTPGPQYLIPFGDTDKAGYYDLFNVTEKEIISMVEKVIQAIRGTGTSDFALLKGNPIFWVFWCCIRYYTLKNDVRSCNTALAIYALAAYPSVFNKYFKHEVSDPACMQYTIDSLTEKYIIKQQGHIFGALVYSIGNSYKFLKPYFKDGSDVEVVRFIQRIRNDQNSIIKKICNQYTINKEKGLRAGITQDSFEDNPVVDDQYNNSSTVELVARKITLPIITNGVDLHRAQICAKIAGISISDCQFYMSRILTDKNNDSIEKFIESILFIYLYDGKRKPEDINTSVFLTWSAELFRKTNSNNDNIRNIKETLDRWAEDIGVHAKFKREASRINYKRAIFFYFILSIQNYNNG